MVVKSIKILRISWKLKPIIISTRFIWQKKGNQRIVAECRRGNVDLAETMCVKLEVLYRALRHLLPLNRGILFVALDFIVFGKGLSGVGEV